MSENRYGVDVTYHESNMKQIMSRIENYTPDELARAFARLSMVADANVVLNEDEFNLSIRIAQ